MSRIGLKPVSVPKGVQVQLAGQAVQVEGPKGKLSFEVHPKIQVALDGASLVCKRADDERQSKALHGLTRALLANMVAGVSEGFSRKLEIVGVGYGAEVQGKSVKITVGFANPVFLPIPEGVAVSVADPTHITVSGPDKQKVGQFAAQIRAVRKPEPYKGTGIKYEGEQIRRKAGKAFGSAAS